MMEQARAVAADGPGEALPGRQGQARRNDALILEAAREVFLNDPKAPVAAVAEHAGVGISALYRRYPSKEDLLRRLCHDGLRRFIAEAEAAGTDPDPWSALSGFLERIVEADVHSLTVHLAGTFTPTPQMHDDAQRAGALAAGLAERAQAAGRLRPDVVADDLGPGTGGLRRDPRARPGPDQRTAPPLPAPAPRRPGRRPRRPGERLPAGPARPPTPWRLPPAGPARPATPRRAELALAPALTMDDSTPAGDFPRPGRQNRANRAAARTSHGRKRRLASRST